MAPLPSPYSMSCELGTVCQSYVEKLLINSGDSDLNIIEVHIVDIFLRYWCQSRDFRRNNHSTARRLVLVQ